MAENKNRESMSSVDTAWLRMERPTNLMMITGVMILKEPLNVQTLRDMLGERFLAFERFKMKSVQDTTGAYWQEDEYFELESHVHRRALPSPADQTELAELASELASTPLDPARPLWQFHLIEDYEGGSALITRIHHCYADGIALIQVLMSMTEKDGSSPREKPKKIKRLRPDNGLKRLYEPASSLVDSTFKLSLKLLGQCQKVLQDPDVLNEYASVGMEYAGELAGLLTMEDDPPTRLRGNGGLGVRKRIAWCDPLPLNEVKTIGKAMGSTVNDVLVACVTGALRRYLIAQGDCVDDLQIRAALPVNLRPPEKASELGNHFGLVLLDLPLGIENPIERLYAVRSNMKKLKQSKQAAISLGLLSAVGRAPIAVQRAVLDQFSNKSTMVMTNVPGPQAPLKFAGSEIKETMFWVPQTGDIGIGVSILSYNGKVQFGMITDRKIIANPESIVNQFADEFECLLLLTLMEPWDSVRPVAEIESSLRTSVEALPE